MEVETMNASEERLVRDGRAIAAIRAYRERTGSSLADAKRESDRISRRIRKGKKTISDQNAALNRWANRTFFGDAKARGEG